MLALFKPIFCAFASEIVSFLGVYVLLILPLTLAKLLTALLLQLAFCLFSARMCIVSCLVVDVLLHLAWFAPLFCAFASCIFSQYGCVLAAGTQASHWTGIILDLHILFQFVSIYYAINCVE